MRQKLNNFKKISFNIHILKKLKYLNSKDLKLGTGTSQLLTFNFLNHGSLIKNQSLKSEG